METTASSSKSPIYNIILLTLFGTLGSVIIGLIVNNVTIFNCHLTSFQFVMAGFYGALFFGLLEYESVWVQLFGVLFMLLINLIIFTGRNLSASYIIRDVFYFTGLFSAIYFYHLFLIKNPTVKVYLRTFALALFYGLSSAVMIIILYMINARVELPPLSLIYTVARNGILIGWGLGLGIDFFYQIQVRLFKDQLSILR